MVEKLRFNEDKSRTQAAEMRFVRSVKRCTHLDQMRNDEITEDLDILQLRIKLIIQIKLANTKNTRKDHQKEF
jgi:hypothetical protein